MKLSLKQEGLNQIILDLQKTTKDGKAAMNAALKDTGKKIAKDLRKERSAGGFVPLSQISKLKGHKKPWGKMKFITVSYKRKDEIIVTTKGLNKTIEEGGYVGYKIGISEKFKRFLHFKGIHLRKTTNKLRVPARPLFKRTWNKIKSGIVSYFTDRFIYRINRSLRRFRFNRR